MAGGSIELTSLCKRFGEHTAVDCIDLSVASGEFFSLLGPSGCGKTTTLRLIAGFEQPTSGRILLDGSDVSGVPAHKRKVNTVFQSYALFPFLSVFDNVAFGLRYASVTKAELRTRVGDALSLVSMTGFASRRPSQLSGGQQQRVALARALVLNPAVLLLDEPLGALDAKLRRSLKVELKALQERVGITFLYVTHDQEEALTMSDRLAVMDSGRIAQIGTPRHVYEEPADSYVADFLGAANLMEVLVTERARLRRDLEAGRDSAVHVARLPGGRGREGPRRDPPRAGARGAARVGRPQPGAGHGGAGRFPRLRHRADPPPPHRRLAPGAAPERRGRRRRRPGPGHSGAPLPAARRAAGPARLTVRGARRRLSLGVGLSPGVGVGVGAGGSRGGGPASELAAPLRRRTNRPYRATAADRNRACTSYGSLYTLQRARRSTSAKACPARGTRELAWRGRRARRGGG